MILNRSFDDTVARIGHDGSAKIFGDDTRRGFHMQEIIDLCDEEECCLTPIEAIPSLMPCLFGTPVHIWSHEESRDRLINAIRMRGIMMGTTLDGIGHAVAIAYGGMAYDPRGSKWPVLEALSHNFVIGTFWRARWLG
jgi:hypothetical protein